LLTDIEHLGADKNVITIEVGIPSKVRLGYPNFDGMGVLRITEGDTAKVKKLFCFHDASNFIHSIVFGKY